MFAVAVTFKIDPPQTSAFKAAMLKNAKMSLTQEVGCRQFDVCMDPKRPNDVFLYEIYDNERAFKTHMSSAHYASFQLAIEGMVKGKEVNVFNEVHQ